MAISLQLHYNRPIGYVSVSYSSFAAIVLALAMARDRLGIVGIAQRATARTRRGIRPSVPRVVSGTPSAHETRWG